MKGCARRLVDGAKRLGSCVAAVALAATVAFPAAAWADAGGAPAGGDDAAQELESGLAADAAAFGTAAPDPAAPDTAAPGPAAPDTAASDFRATASSGEITIMHTNDIHGFYTWDARNLSIGFPVMQAIKDALDPDLVLDAGDTFHGQSFATMTEGATIAELMDALGFDATTPGNHDWSYGAARLRSIDASCGFSVLAANVVDAQTGKPYFERPCLVKEVDVELSDGTTQTAQVGVLGVIDEGFYGSTAAANVAAVRFEDPVAAANEAADELRAAGCDVVVALTHNADPQGFAAQTSGIDAVIAGHEHVVADDAVKNAADEDVAVVEAGHYLQYVGVLDLQVTCDDKGTPDASDDEWAVTGHAEKPVSFGDAAAYAADPDVANLVDGLAAKVAETAEEVVGTSGRAYPYEPTVDGPGGWEKVRTEDTPIGHAVTAAYLDATGADLAFENAGGIRGGIPEGDVTAADLLAISPYGNTLATYRLAGAQIRSALEHSLEISAQCRAVLAQQVAAIEAGEDPMQYSWPDDSGSVLVVGGATMEIDWSKPEGQRIASVSVGGAPLDDGRTYVVAMNSYLPQLTDVYPAFASLELAEEWGTCEQALRAFVGSSGWEDRIYPLTGTVTYIEAPDGKDDEGEDEGDEKPPAISEAGDDEPADDLANAPAPSRLAATGNDASAAAAALGALAALAVAAAAVVRAQKLRAQACRMQRPGPRAGWGR